MIRLVRVKNAEVGLRFRNGRLVEALQPGWYLARTILGETVAS